MPINHVFILLLHEKLELVESLITLLLESDTAVVIHYDAKSDVHIEDIKKKFNYNSRLYFAERVKVGWAEWSIVKATLNAIKCINDNELNPDYVTLLSGACVPLKSLDSFYNFLAQNKGTDFIETHDVTKSQWVKGGIEKERWEYTHPFNWREQPNLFAINLLLKKIFTKKRKLPDNYIPHMGSQWWSLTWNTCFSAYRYALIHEKFYEKTLVPDELFFQTYVANNISEENRLSTSLTMFRFTPWCIPKIYYKDHELELHKNPFFFVRKVADKDLLLSFHDSEYDISDSTECTDDFYKQLNFVHDYPRGYHEYINKKFKVFFNYDGEMPEYLKANNNFIFHQKDALDNFSYQEIDNLLLLSGDRDLVLLADYQHVPSGIKDNYDNCNMSLFFLVDGHNGAILAENFESNLTNIRCQYRRVHI